MKDYAALYRRVSTGHQEGSLDVQEAKLANYLMLKGLVSHTSLEFFDEETSGGIAFADRDGGRSILSALEHGFSPQLGLTPEPVKHLVVAKLDRLGRKATDMLQLLQWLDERKITLHIVDLGGDAVSTGGPVGRLMFALLAHFAEFERDMIRTRITDRLSKKFKDNEVIGTIPYGFRPVDAEGRSVTKIQTGTNGEGKPIMAWPKGTKLTDDPTEQYWIREMAQRMTEANANYNRVATWLNQRQVPTKTGVVGGWQTANVKKVLESKHTAEVLKKKPLNDEQNID
ncbi:MAG TPA: recombinase family protein [Verrucomicrobiae bacterium]